MARHEPAGLSPVVIVGTHRSGTSALTGALAQLGLHIGARLDENNESTFFQRLSRHLSSEAGGHWTNPEAVWRTISTQGDLAALVGPLRSHLDGPGSIEFWGWRQMTRPQADLAWGWKNPRTTYLLPIWAELFPALRVVWIRRDPRDCAASMVRRSHAIRANIERAAGDRSLRAGLRRTREAIQGYPIIADGLRGLDPTSALEITMAYAELQERLLRDGDYPVHEVQYDELVDTPAEILNGCATFAGLTPTSAEIAAAAGKIKRREVSHLPPSAGTAVITPALTDRLRSMGYGER